MPSTLKVGVASLSSPLEVGAGNAHKAASDLHALLESIGCTVVDVGPINGSNQAIAAGRQMAEAHVNAIALIATSWYEDYLVLDLLEECSAPVMIWSLPGMETGALCGTQQLTSYLKYLGIHACCIYGDLGNPECIRKTSTFLRAAALKYTLRRTRVGLMGSRVNGMTHTAANEFALKKSIGPRVVFLDSQLILERVKNVSEKEAALVWQNILGKSAKCCVAQADGLYSAQMYLALREVIAEYNLNAIAIGCYPNLMGKVCLAASLLADEGIPLACEGDLNGAVGQVILTTLTGQPTHNTDWLEPLDDGTVIFTHCGSGSFSLAAPKEKITLSPVRLMEQGACVLFPAKVGPVTLISLTPAQDGYQCAILEGEALPVEMVFPGNPVRVHFDQPVESIMSWIHEQGISHHWMIGYGHVGEEVREWNRIAGSALHVISLNNEAHIIPAQN